MPSLRPLDDTLPLSLGVLALRWCRQLGDLDCQSEARSTLIVAEKAATSNTLLAISAWQRSRGSQVTRVDSGNRQAQIHTTNRPTLSRRPHRACRPASLDGRGRPLSAAELENLACEILSPARSRELSLVPPDALLLSRQHHDEAGNDGHED